jgi:hypothetical protein
MADARLENSYLGRFFTREAGQAIVDMSTRAVGQIAGKTAADTLAVHLSNDHFIGACELISSIIKSYSSEKISELSDRAALELSTVQCLGNLFNILAEFQTAVQSANDPQNFDPDGSGPKGPIYWMAAAVALPEPKSKEIALAYGRNVSAHVIKSFEEWAEGVPDSDPLFGGEIKKRLESLLIKLGTIENTNEEKLLAILSALDDFFSIKISHFSDALRLAGEASEQDALRDVIAFSYLEQRMIQSAINSIKCDFGQSEIEIYYYRGGLQIDPVTHMPIN